MQKRPSTASALRSSAIDVKHHGAVFEVGELPEDTFEEVRAKVQQKFNERDAKLAAEDMLIKRHHEAELAKFSFDSLTDGELGPACIAFYKFFARKSAKDEGSLPTPHLEMLVPDTIVYNDEDNPFWIYTSKDGKIHRNDSFTDRTVVKKLSANDDVAIAAVLKRQHWEKATKKNEISLLDNRELRMLATSSTQGLHCVQKFLKCRGPRAWIARTVYDHHRAPYAWVITNKAGFSDTSGDPRDRNTTATEIPGAVTAFRMAGRAVRDLSLLNLKIVEFLERSIHVRFEELVCDFLRDEKNRWWLLQIKGYKLRIDPERPLGEGIPPSNQVTSLPPKFSETVRLRRCRCCGVGYPPPDLTYSLTQRMVRDLASHLRGRGIVMRWFKRADVLSHETQSAGSIATGAGALAVCRSCYDLYLAERRLVQLETEFSKAIGVPPMQKQKQLLAQEGRMPHDWHLDLEGDHAITISRNLSSLTPPVLTLFRAIVILHELHDVPAFVGPPIPVSMEFSLFGTVTKVPLVLGSPLIPVCKVRTFHLLLQADDAAEFLLQEKDVRIEIRRGVPEQRPMFSLSSANVTPMVSRLEDSPARYLQEDESLMGSSTLSLSQLATGNVGIVEARPLFSGTQMGACRLRAAVGVERLRQVDVSTISSRLKQYQPNVWLPEPSYCSSTPLPDEWMSNMPARSTVSGPSSRGLSPPKEVLRSTPQLAPREQARSELWTITIQLHAVHSLPVNLHGDSIHLEFEFYGQKIVSESQICTIPRPLVLDLERRFELESPTDELRKRLVKEGPLNLRLVCDKRGLLGSTKLMLGGLAENWSLEGAYEFNPSPTTSWKKSQDGLPWLSASVYLGPKEGIEEAVLDSPSSSFFLTQHDF